ncbi:YfcE family phosphodiesterase, partial [Aeromonas sp. HMWF036]
MKLAIISDIHGSIIALERVLTQLEPWRPDHYLLLGDLLNHG